MISINFFGAAPDGGFRSFPSGRSEALKHYDTSSDSNYQECIYKTYDGFSIVNYIEHGVVSGHRGTRSFGISIAIKDAVINKERLTEVSDFIKDYINTNLVGERRIFIKQHGRAIYRIATFSAIESEMTFWLKDLTQKFLKKFAKDLIPKSKGVQPDGLSILVSSSEETSTQGRHEVEAIEAEADTNSHQDQAQEVLFDEEKLPRDDENFNNPERSYTHYRQDTNIRFRKPVWRFRSISKKGVLMVLTGILAFHTLLLFKISYTTGKTSDLLENLVAKNLKLSEVNGSNTKFQKANPLASHQKSIPDYIVKEGDALGAIVNKINRRYTKAFTVDEIAEKNSITFDTIRGWYNIIPKDIIAFE